MKKVFETRLGSGSITDRLAKIGAELVKHAAKVSDGASGYVFCTTEGEPEGIILLNPEGDDVTINTEYSGKYLELKLSKSRPENYDIWKDYTRMRDHVVLESIKRKELKYPARPHPSRFTPTLLLEMASDPLDIGMEIGFYLVQKHIIGTYDVLDFFSRYLKSRLNEEDDYVSTNRKRKTSTRWSDYDSQDNTMLLNEPSDDEESLNSGKRKKKRKYIRISQYEAMHTDSLLEILPKIINYWVMSPHALGMKHHIGIYIQNIKRKEWMESLGVEELSVIQKINKLRKHFYFIRAKNSYKKQRNIRDDKEYKLKLLQKSEMDIQIMETKRVLAQRYAAIKSRPYKTGQRWIQRKLLNGWSYKDIAMRIKSFANNSRTADRLT